MGQEATVTARWAGASSSGKAMLEGDHLLFRGDFRVKLMLADLASVAVDGDALVLTAADGVLSLELGAVKAADWQTRIRNPKTVLDKLGIKPGICAALCGREPDAALLAELARVGIATAGVGPGDADLVLLTTEIPDDLDAVPTLAAALGPKAGLWIIYPKGGRSVTQDQVFAAGRGAGLVDNKVCAVSPTHTALKFVRRQGVRQG